MMNEILLGDCYELIKQIPDKSVDLVYTDIPYLQVQGGGKIGSRIAKNIVKERKTIDAIVNGIDYTILDELVRVMKYIYIYIYIWCSKEQMLDIMNYFNKKDVMFNLLVWCKTNPTPATNGNWLPDLEYCLVFKEKGTPRYNDGYEIKSKFYVSKKNQEDKKIYKHPTIKPLDLVKRHLLHSTKEGDVILDCFCGSGTTCVAAKQLGRNFIGMELNEEYWKIANDRLNNIDANGQKSLF